MIRRMPLDCVRTIVGEGGSGVGWSGMEWVGGIELEWRAAECCRWTDSVGCTANFGDRETEGEYYSDQGSAPNSPRPIRNTRQCEPVPVQKE